MLCCSVSGCMSQDAALLLFPLPSSNPCKASPQKSTVPQAWGCRRRGTDPLCPLSSLGSAGGLGVGQASVLLTVNSVCGSVHVREGSSNVTVLHSQTTRPHPGKRSGYTRLPHNSRSRHTYTCTVVHPTPSIRLMGWGVLQCMSSADYTI